MTRPQSDPQNPSAIVRRAPQRSLFLYVVLGILLFRLINPQVATVNRLNRIKVQIEEDLDRFALGEAPLKRDSFKWGVRYYKKVLSLLLKAALISGDSLKTSLAYGNLGYCYYYLSDEQSALEAYQKAVNLAPAFYSYSWDLGTVYFQKGDLKNALDLHRRSLEAMPLTLKYYSSFFRSIAHLGFPAEGVLTELFKRAYVDEERSFRIMSRVFFEGREFERMRDTVLLGLVQHADSAGLSLDAGLAFMMLGDYAQAAVFFEKVMELSPGDGPSAHYRDFCLNRSGDNPRDDQESLEDIWRKEASRFRFELEKDFRLHLNDQLLVWVMRF